MSHATPVRRVLGVGVQCGAWLLLAAFFGTFIARGTFIVHNVRVFTLFDDAMISMRYAQNLALGYGLTWNPGDAPVEGYTNPLWTLWMALLHVVGIAPARVGLWVSLSSALLVIGCAACMRALARRLYPDDRTIATLIFWATATYYPLVFWSLRGMEVGLVTLCVIGAVLLTTQLQTRFTDWTVSGIGLVLSLAILTRMELLAPAGVISAYAVWASPAQRRLRVAATLGAFLTVTLGGLTAWRLDYYGEWLPNTYYLKLGDVPLSARLARGTTWVVLTCALHLAGLLAMIATGLRRRRLNLMPGEALVLGLFGLMCVYSAWVGGDAWDFYLFANRFLTPAVPCLILLALRSVGQLTTTSNTLALRGLGIVFVVFAALDWLPVRGELTAPASVRGVASVAIAAALLAAPAIKQMGVGTLRLVLSLLLIVGLNLSPFAGWVLYNAPHSIGDRGWAAYGLLLKDTTSPETTVAVTWAGNVTYFSGRRTFDQLGKTDSLIAHGPNVNPEFRPGHSKWNFRHTFADLHPDLIAALYSVTDADLAQIEEWGYVPLLGNCYVRRDTSGIQAVSLRAGLLAINQDPRFPDTVCVRQDANSAFPDSRARTAGLAQR